MTPKANDLMTGIVICFAPFIHFLTKRAKVQITYEAAETFCLETEI